MQVLLATTRQCTILPGLAEVSSRKYDNCHMPCHTNMGTAHRDFPICKEEKKTRKIMDKRTHIAHVTKQTSISSHYDIDILFTSKTIFIRYIWL